MTMIMVVEKAVLMTMTMIKMKIVEVFVMMIMIIRIAVTLVGMVIAVKLVHHENALTPNKKDNFNIFF